MEICNIHNHDHTKCPACIENERVTKYLKGKIELHIQLNKDMLKQLQTTQDIVDRQRKELSTITKKYLEMQVRPKLEI